MFSKFQSKLCSLFQFLCGAIEGIPVSELAPVAMQFQFLCGAIEGFLIKSFECMLEEFQFLCGAIEGLEGLVRIFFCCFISIPVWCD